MLKVLPSIVLGSMIMVSECMGKEAECSAPLTRRICMENRVAPMNVILFDKLLEQYEEYVSSPGCFEESVILPTSFPAVQWDLMNHWITDTMHTRCHTSSWIRCIIRCTGVSMLLACVRHSCAGSTQVTAARYVFFLFFASLFCIVS